MVGNGLGEVVAGAFPEGGFWGDECCHLKEIEIEQKELYEKIWKKLREKKCKELGLSVFFKSMSCYSLGTESLPTHDFLCPTSFKFYPAITHR